MPDYPEAQPSGISKDSVYLLAESVRKQFDFKPGADIEPIVERLGGRITVAPVTSSENSGSISIHGEGNFDIFLAMDTGRTRDRFTIAHELGHYVLHFLWKRKCGENISSLQAKRYDSTRAEWEANWFAAAFLMPEEPFRKAFSELQENVAAVAQRFGVSARAAEIRAQALQLA